MYTTSLFKSIENKLDVYRGKDCMIKFCEFLKQHTMKVINLRKKTEVINKRAAGIIKKSVLFVKNNLKVNI